MPSDIRPPAGLDVTQEVILRGVTGPIYSYDADGNVITPVKAATSVLEHGITCVLADTEYSYALPASWISLQFKGRAWADVRFAFTAGRVATPVGVYYTLDPGQPYAIDSVSMPVGKTLYVASSTAGAVVEVVVLK